MNTTPETLAKARAAGIKSACQVYVLGRLNEKPFEPISFQELRTPLKITGAGMTHTADKLSLRGLTRRLPIPGDRRKYALEITTAGMLLADAIF